MYAYTLGRERCDGIQQNIALCALPVWVETGWEGKDITCVTSVE